MTAGVFALFGACMGAVYIAFYFFSSFITKKEWLRHIANVIYAAIYAVIFAEIEIRIFNYDLHAYHFFIPLATTFLFAGALYLPIRKYSGAIKKRCDAAIAKVKQSKHFKRFVK